MNHKYITEMSSSEAKKFFLKPSTFVPLALPSYYKFDTVLKIAEEELKNSKIEDISKSKTSLSKSKDVNYTLLLNKDARYDWRPIQIVHPIVYVDLVNYMCEHWNEIIKKFKSFEKNEKIKCISIPLESTSKKNNDKEETILNWWESLEQASIKYSLNFKYCIKTDITNCYGSIYTHTISWALNGKKNAKENRNDKNNLGNTIDKKIEYMQNGQTNGIPQGGSLFDTIAELILGYSDLEMTKWLDEFLANRPNNSLEYDYQIIRYRDDYRIFTNSKDFAEKIIRKLSDTLADLNMHFNSKKTLITTDIIGTAIKPAKLYWTKQQPILYSKFNIKILDSKSNTFKNKQIIHYNLSIQKHLWQIYELSQKFPNSGQVQIALSEFLKRIQRLDFRPNVIDYQPLISIIANIILQSPNAIPLGVSILSIILNKIEDKSEIIKTVDLIKNKFQDIPNISFIEIWLQRLTLLIYKNKDYNEPLCQKIYKSVHIWNSEWLKKPLDESSIINKNIVKNLNIIIPQKEVSLFNGYSSQ